jgi:hypothetical protein
MDPNKVRPGKFHQHTIIYDDGNFSIAYGIWDNSEKRVAMRWNGEDNEIGYPSQGGNPLWFQLPNEGIWLSEILKMVDNIKNHEQNIKDLDAKL